MRALIAIGIILGLSATVPQAQATTKKATVGKKAKSQYLLAANAKKLNKKATAEKGALPAATASAEATTTSASAAAVKADATASKWGLLIDSWNEIGVKSLNRNGTPATAYTLIRPKYKISADQSIAVGQYLTHSWGTTSGDEATFGIDDTYVQFADSDIGTIAGDIKASAYGRVYLPVSEFSQHIGQQAYLRAGFSLKKALGSGFSLSYSGSPRYYVQSYSSYKHPATGAITNNRDYRYVQYLNASKSFGDKWSAYQLLGMDHSWFHNDGNATKNTQRQERLLAETMVSYAATKQFSVAGGVTSYARDLRAQKNDFSIYREDETNYVVDLTLSY